jgi:hypothetical protein
MNSKVDVSLRGKMGKMLEKSTCHAWPNILRTPHTSIKLIWLLFFVLSASTCAITLVQSINAYMQFEVIVNVQYEKTGNIRFPAVSICNLNPFLTNTSAESIRQLLYDMNVTDLVISDVLDANAGRFLNQHFTFSKFLYQSRLLSNNFTNEQRKDALIQLEDMLLSCKYGTESCSANDFEWFFTFDYGSCYKFKMEKFIRRRGKFSGLKLELFAHYPESLFNLASTSGLHLFINNQSIDPVRAEGIDVSTGYETNVALSKTSIHKLSEPHGNCIEDTLSNNSFRSELYRLTLEKYDKYRIRACFDMCYQDFIVKNCACYSSLFPNINDKYEPCGLSVEKNKCNLDYHVIFYTNVSRQVCPNLCPNECDSVDFSLKTSFATFPSRPYAEILAKKHAALERKFISNGTLLNFNLLKHSVLALNVYFDNLYETVVDEVPSMTVTDLIGLIGGK